jgi:hypothetical protein
MSEVLIRRIGSPRRRTRASGLVPVPLDNLSGFPLAAKGASRWAFQQPLPGAQRLISSPRSASMPDSGLEDVVPASLLPQRMP